MRSRSPNRTAGCSTDRSSCPDGGQAVSGRRADWDCGWCAESGGRRRCCERGRVAAGWLVARSGRRCAAVAGAARRATGAAAGRGHRRGAGRSSVPGSVRAGCAGHRSCSGGVGAGVWGRHDRECDRGDRCAVASSCSHRGHRRPRTPPASGTGGRHHDRTQLAAGSTRRTTRIAQRRQGCRVRSRPSRIRSRPSSKSSTRPDRITWPMTSATYGNSFTGIPPSTLADT